jgi:protein-tyrosine phosphatase
MDAHLIAPLLSVGSKPMIFDVKSHGYDVVVLCAEEVQDVKTNALTVHIPLFDTEMANEQTVRAADLLFTVNQLVEMRKQGKHILVTCFMGKNRSAFVAALILVKSGWTANGAIQRIRERRKLRIAGKALQNRRFEKIVKDYGRGR